MYNNKFEMFQTIISPLNLIYMYKYKPHLFYISDI